MNFLHQGYGKLVGKHQTHSWEYYQRPPQMLWFPIYALLCKYFHWISDNILLMKDYYALPLKCLLHYILEPYMIAPVAKTTIFVYTLIGCQIFYLHWRIAITHLGGDNNLPSRQEFRHCQSYSMEVLYYFFWQKMTWKRWDDLLWPTLQKIRMPHGSFGSCLNCNYGSHWGGCHWCHACWFFQVTAWYYSFGRKCHRRGEMTFHEQHCKRLTHLTRIMALV